MPSKKKLKARILFLERQLSITELEWQQRLERQRVAHNESTFLLREQLNKLVLLKAEALSLYPPIRIIGTEIKLKGYKWNKENKLSKKN